MPLFGAEELAAWSGGTWIQLPARDVRGVSSDSRTIEDGNLFIALEGERYDGHGFVRDAFGRGAAAAMVSETRLVGLRETLEPGTPLLAVKKTSEALLAIAEGHRDKIGPDIVAVTGSAGKSTVKELTADMLAGSFSTARTRGNWNNSIGLPLSLLAMESNCRMGVFEIGTNHPGEVEPLCSILKPSWSVVTNVGPVHIGLFGSVEAIAEEKSRVLAGLPIDGVGVLDLDSPWYGFLCDRAPSRVVTVSLGEGADYVCRERDVGKGEMTVIESESGEESRLPTCLHGAHNALNVLFATAVARGHGVGWEAIEAAAAGFKGLPMRWEARTVGGRRILNDAYNANPMSMRAAVDTLWETESEARKWLVLGGMQELGDREQEEHLDLGRFVGEHNPAGLVVVGDLGRLIARGALDAGYGGLVVETGSALEAASVLAEKTDAGDHVLLKASRGFRLEDIALELVRTLEGDT
ncbi:MAG: UDP-N-acetylmuramoyl-tripeptide--D-alanyl-D-alanine ligase [Lentisphaerae bacterium]|nr:UDP-N-acetylmuramoyl-tripeptide--D-alanyl-D-alanine ligase [Lentisphaerota bacterium]